MDIGNYFQSVLATPANGSGKVMPIAIYPWLAFPNIASDPMSDGNLNMRQTRICNLGNIIFGNPRIPMTLEICPCHFLGREGARQRPRIDGIGFEGIAILGAPISHLDGVSVDLGRGSIASTVSDCNIVKVPIDIALGQREEIWLRKIELFVKVRIYNRISREEQNVMNIASYHVDTHREEALKDQPAAKRDTAERFAGRHRSRKILDCLLLWFVSLVGRGGVAVELPELRFEEESGELNFSLNRASL